MILLSGTPAVLSKKVVRWRTLVAKPHTLKRTVLAKCWRVLGFSSVLECLAAFYVPFQLANSMAERDCRLSSLTIAIDPGRPCVAGITETLPHIYDNVMTSFVEGTIVDPVQNDLCERAEFT